MSSVSIICSFELKRLLKAFWAAFPEHSDPIKNQSEAEFFQSLVEAIQPEDAKDLIDAHNMMRPIEGMDYDFVKLLITLNHVVLPHLKSHRILPDSLSQTLITYPTTLSPYFVHQGKPVNMVLALETYQATLHDFIATYYSLEDSPIQVDQRNFARLTHITQDLLQLTWAIHCIRSSDRRKAIHETHQRRPS